MWKPDEKNWKDENTGSSYFLNSVLAYEVITASQLSPNNYARKISHEIGHQIGRWYNVNRKGDDQAALYSSMSVPLRQQPTIKSIIDLSKLIQFRDLNYSSLIESDLLLIASVEEIEAEVEMAAVV